MPAPERTSLARIVAAARDLLESDGPERLTMQSVAEVVGVRAPSLYKRVAGRDALLGLVADDVAAALGDDLDAALADPALGARDRAARLARTLRRFAAAHPHGYQLLFRPWRVPERERSDGHARLTGILLAVTEDLAGPRESLPAARTLVAWCHGFASMEHAGVFELGGDLDESFEFGLGRLLDALE